MMANDDYEEVSPPPSPPLPSSRRRRIGTEDIIIRRDPSYPIPAEREEISYRERSMSPTPFREGKPPIKQESRPPTRPVIRAPPIHQEIITHHRHIDHGLKPGSPANHQRDDPMGQGDTYYEAPPPRTGRSESKDRVALVEKPFAEAQDEKTRMVYRFNGETDFEYEINLRRTLWKAGISRQVAEKVINAHRAKEAGKGGVHEYGLSFSMREYERLKKELATVELHDTTETHQPSYQANHKVASNGKDHKMNESEADSSNQDLSETANDEKLSSLLKLPRGTSVAVLRLPREGGTMHF